MKVTLITCHTPFSARKAGFHWLANSFRRKGWDVNFVTGYSIVDYLKRDYRFKLLKDTKFNVAIHVEEGFSNYVAFRWWRPFNLQNGYLNKLTQPFFRRYGDWKKEAFYQSISGSRIIVLESTYDLLYFPEVKKRNPGAKFIYRVSDDLTTFNVHPFMIDAEEVLSESFDLVSVPNRAIYNRFKRFCNPVLQPHGIPKYLFDIETVNPYRSEGKNAIFVGNSSFDHGFLKLCSLNFQDVYFHIIGPIAREVESDNVIYYGEIPYKDTIKYIKNADVALSPMITGGLMESNKIIQYRYCRLPIVISDVNKGDEDNIFYYTPGNENSIIAAMNAALSCDIEESTRDGVTDWDDLVEEFAR